MKCPERILRFGICLLWVIPVYGMDSDSPNNRKVWIFFHEPHTRSVDSGPSRYLTRPTLGNRLMYISRNSAERSAAARFSDRLVSPSYIRKLEEMGVDCHVRSRWLNGVSAFLDESLMASVRQLPFVRSVQPVASYDFRPLPDIRMPRRNAAPVMDVLPYDYGPGLRQVEQIRVPEVHALGLDGSGVLIGIIDTGFEYIGRTVFNQTDIVAEYDFHFGDANTENEEGDTASQHNHGTRVLSAIGGFHEGHLIGPAFGGSYALAKTEWVPTETNIEEDHWVAGIEWLESMGADVVTSSLGYSTFDPGNNSYTYADMDGNTAVTTVAADMAAAMGVIVVTSAGNEYGAWNYVTAPADGDSVIAVGAVTEFGSRASFSSVGPTADGRIKPDVAALGVGVQLVDPSWSGRPFDSEYSNGSGTSYACPLVAGVCALILQAHPELDPMDVREALRETADRSAAPDTNTGWGIVDAYEAVFFHGAAFTRFESSVSPDSQKLFIDFCVHYKEAIRTDSVFFTYGLEIDGPFNRIHAELLDEASQRYRVELPPEIDPEDLLFYCEAEDVTESRYTGPIDAPEGLYRFPDSTSGTGPSPASLPVSIVLHQNYPNPFNDRTVFAFEIDRTFHVSLTLFDVRGREVVKLLDSVVTPGAMEIAWDAVGNSGERVASGLYLCVLKAGEEHRVRKVLLSR